jgi:hypothetical protein
MFKYFFKLTKNDGSIYAIVSLVSNNSFKAYQMIKSQFPYLHSHLVVRKEWS